MSGNIRGNIRGDRPGMTEESCIKEMRLRKDFTIGHSYGKDDERPARTIACKKCGCYKLIVGRGSYFTAVKCPRCNWEVCIHQG